MGAFSDADPRARPWFDELYALANRLGLQPRVTSVRRSVRAQQILWERRQAVLRGDLPPSAQPFPVARPGSSTHELGLAADIVVRPDGGQRVLGDVWTGWGGFWTASDAIHYGIGPNQLLRPPPPGLTSPPKSPSVGAVVRGRPTAGGAGGAPSRQAPARCCCS